MHRAEAPATVPLNEAAQGYNPSGAKPDYPGWHDDPNTQFSNEEIIMDTQIPADLSAATAEELAELQTALDAEFDAQYDADGDITVLSEIANANDQVKQAIAAKAADAAAEEAKRDELRQRMDADKATEIDVDAEAVEADATADEAEAAPADADEPGEPAPAAEDNDTAAEAPVEERELVTASAKPPKPSARATSARQAPVEAPNNDNERVVITAAADVPGFSTGTNLTRDQLAVAMHSKARGLSDGGQRVPVGTVKSPTPDEHIVKADSDLEAIMASVTQIPSGGAEALLASGGWCTPSETMFDLFSIESRDGLFDLPTIGISRGGIQVPSFFTIGAASGALWTWTEDDDTGGEQTISDLDIATDVATATTAAPHNYRTGETVKISATGVGNLDGTYTITVTGASTFTFATSGVADSVNNTGLAQVVKGCAVIPCPTWTDYRLEAEGMCVTHGNLMDRSYPEMTARFIDLVMTSHEHRVSSARLAKVIAGSTAVTVTGAGTDGAGDVLNAIDLQVADYRSEYLMSDSAVLEAAVPQWLRSAVRATLAMRAGVDMMAVSDAEINAFFTARQVRPQYVQGYEPLATGTPLTAWPTTSKMLLYPAGGFVQGEGGSIDLGIVRDSTLNSTNDFTAAWSEQFYTVIQRGPNAREVTFDLGIDGKTGGPSA